MPTKYLDANGNEVALSTLERGALIGNMSIEEYAALADFTIQEGEPKKTKDSVVGTATAESKIMTPAGDSSSGDILLEQLEKLPPKSLLIETNGMGTRDAVAKRRTEELYEYNKKYKVSTSGLMGQSMSAQLAPRVELTPISKDETFAIEIEENDLELNPTESNLYFNPDKDNSFVNEYYNVAELEDNENFNTTDFQGYLNKVGFTKDFTEDLEINPFTGRSAYSLSAADFALDNTTQTSFLSGGDSTAQERQKNLIVQKERALELHLKNYIKETESNAKKKAFIKSYNADKSVYSEAENFEDAYEMYLFSNNPNSIYDEDKINKYNTNNFLALDARTKEIKEKKNAKIKEELEQGNVSGILNAVGEGASNAAAAFPRAYTDLKIMAADIIGLDGFATRSRAEIAEEERLDVKGEGGYLLARGKSLVIDGKKYLKAENGLIYDVEQSTAINSVTDPIKLAEISDKIDSEGENDFDFSLAGLVIQGGAVVGDVLAQILGQKGLGAVRKGASLALIAKTNKFKNAKQLKSYMKAKNSVGNRRGMNPKGIQNVETFGFKLPVDAAIIDATMFQSMYGAVSGYEGTIRAAKAAGLSNDEAHMLAVKGASQMSILYGATGFINPRIPAIGKLDDLLASNGLFNKAIKNYRSTGDIKNFSGAITKFTKDLTKSTGKGIRSFTEEGAKEVVQENIQQAGENLIVNKNINEAAGQKILNQTYTIEDVINTSILSFAVGGLAGGSISGMEASPDQKLQNLFEVGKNLKGAKVRFDYLVDKGRMTKKEADDLLEQAKAVHDNAPAMPDWLYESEVDIVEASVILERIKKEEKLKKRTDPMTHGPIDKKINKLKEDFSVLLADAELKRLADAKKEIDQDVKTVKNIAGEENVKVYQNSAEMEADGVEPKDLNSDGFMKIDGTIFINLDQATKTRAISVASHELLHNILRNEMKNNSEKMPEIINQLRDILKEKGALKAVENRLKAGIESGIYDITFNEDGSVSGADIDEYITFFSDAIAAGDLPFKALNESLWRKIGRLIVNAWKTKLGNVDKEFSNGQQVFDFIRDYQASIKKGKLSYQAKAKKKSSDSLIPETKEQIAKRKEVLKNVSKTPGTKSSFTGDSEFKATNKTDLFGANTIAFNKAAELFGLDIKLNEDGTPAFTKAEWDGIDDNTKLGLGFVLGETWQPYVKYLMGSRRDVPGFDEYASQIIDRVSTGVEKGNDGIPFLIKTYNPEGGAKLSSYIFGQIGRRLQGAIDKQDGFGEITVDAVSDKPGAKELVQEETTTAVDDTPKYKNLVRRRIVNPVTMSNIESKIIPILRVLKTPMDASVSNNVTTKPWVNELRLQLGKQVDLIIKQEMGGVKGGELRRFLLKNKTAILENMTTTYLTKAMPFAVQKSVAGVYTSNWQGQKIDRETTSTQKAGRTSGNELVRRLPKASLRISDAEFLAAVVGPGGNPIRGRKEALAKAIAEELSLDIIAAELKKPESKISEVFKQNQSRLGVDVNETISTIVDRDLERGTIKLSNTAQSKFTERSEKLEKIEAKYKKLAEKNTDNELTEDQEEQRRIDKAAVMSNVLDQLLAIRGLDQMPDLRTEQGRVEMIKRLRDMIKILPREALFGPRFGSSFTASSALLGMSKDNPIWIDWQKQIKEIGRAAVASGDFAPSLKPVNGIAINFKTIAFSKFAKGGAASIKNNIAGIKQANRQNMAQYRALLTQLFDAVAIDPQKNAGTVAAYLQLSSNHSTHIHRLAAAFVGYSTDFKYGRGKGVLEHTMTSSEALSYVVNNMIEAATDKNIVKLEDKAAKFEEMIDTVMAQYTVLALSKESDKKLIGWLKNSMPKGWDINTGLWVARYQDANIDLNTIIMFNGQTLGDLIKTPEGKKFIKALNNESAKQLAEIEANPKEFAAKTLSNTKKSFTEVKESSKDLNKEINEMISRQKGVPANETFAEVDARMKGKKIGKYNFFAPGADDFRGLTAYTFAGKGKQGEADQAFFEDNLVKPYQRGVAAISVAKQTAKKDFAFVVKSFPNQAKMMSETVPGTEYTYDQALRIYLWQRQGMEIPGVKPETVRNLSRAISENPSLIEFANATLLASKQGEWMAPDKFWATQTLLSGLYNMTENLGRKVYLAEFITNADIIFSPENLNKMEALYGSKYIVALKNSLVRMKSGSNKVSSEPDADVNRWNNWVNQSTGAIMFFNIRSAVLQTLSIANFTNWSDNNPAKQAMAFANQKQYWADFAMIFNSPKLKERRSGLKNDVNASELANAAKGETNKAGAVLNKMLELGFKPTQIADSFAIAAGGAAFYRNRVNTYLKQDMSIEAAEKLAFEEFSSNADESQQSSDPMLVSKQQASVLGRLILAFQNTPMQYTRLMKKAGQDIINGRGDFKTNMSKILYYGAIQNLIFASMQSALFAFIPGYMDDDDGEEFKGKLEGKELRVLNSMMDSLLKGSGLTGAVLATIKNSIMEFFKQDARGYNADFMYVTLQVLSISPPIGSKIRKLYNAYQTYKFEKDSLARGASVIANGRVNLSPAYSIVGNLAAATLNIPGDRIVDQVTSLSEALDSRNSQWQRLALLAGWKTWDVGAKNEERDLLKLEGKRARKVQGVVTRALNKIKKSDRIAAMTDKEYNEYLNELEKKAEESAIIKELAGKAKAKAIDEYLEKNK